ADPFLRALGFHRAPLALLGQSSSSNPPTDARCTHVDYPSRVPRAVTLRVERPLESLQVHRLPALPRNDLRQVDGESVGVVQLEGLVARYDLRTLEILEAGESAL